MVLLAVALSAACAPIRLPAAPAASTPSNQVSFTLNGKPVDFTIGVSTYADVTGTLGQPLLDDRHKDGTRTVTYVYGDLDRATETVGRHMTSNVYVFDARDVLTDYRSADASNDQALRRAANARLRKRIDEAEAASRNGAVAYRRAQEALLVRTMSDRCGWALSARERRKADALVEAEHPYSAEADFRFMVAAGGGASSVDTNTLCLTHSWREKFDAARRAVDRAR